MARARADFAVSGWRRQSPYQARIGPLAAVLVALLAGCSVTTPASVVSTTGQLPQGNPVQLAPYETDGTLRGEFGQQLENALIAQSIEVTGEAPVIAAFAIAMRDARSGVADPAASSADAIVWESRPRPGSMFDSCDAQRLRATLVLLERAGGEILYRGAGESTRCDHTETDLAELANALVADASGSSSTQ